MRIFLDTNVLLEYFRNRAQAETVEKILSFIRSNGHQGYFSVGSFYTLIYILDTELKKENLHNPERLVKLRYILKGILSEYNVSYEADLKAAVEDEHFLNSPPPGRRSTRRGRW